MAPTKSFLLRSMLYATLFYFSMFNKLGTHSLREWDEARNAINALEMTKTGNLLVRTYQYKPDLWETKPPFLIWLQAGLFKIFGYHEWVLRMPSAIAGFLLAFFLIIWCKLSHIGEYTGVISALILLTAPGFVGDHAARTGDHDAMLCLFSTIFVLTSFS